MTNSPLLRVGLVGSGFLARTRARCWRRVHGVRVELTALATRERERGEAFAREWGIERVHDSASALFADDDIDLVDLCVPNHLHRPFAVEAAAAKKAILCTKPMAAYVGQDLPGGGGDAAPEDVYTRERETMLAVAVEDAQAMVEAAREHEVALHYGENWVYAPAIQRAAELTASSSGALLEMRGWESHSGSHSPYAKEWRHTGGGALLRLGAHPIGAMLWLKREEGRRRGGRPIRPVSVTAEVADVTQNPALIAANTKVATGWNGVESWGCAIIAFEDGSRGVAYGSDAMLGGMQSRLQLLASDHHLECNLSPHDLVRAYAPADGTFGDSYVMEKLDGQAGWTTPLPDEDWSSGQQGLCQAVAEAQVEGRASAADGELGLEVTRLVYSAYVSAAEGRRVSLA